MLIACFLLWKIIMRLSTFCDYSYHIKPSMYHISKRGCKVRGNCWGNRGPWLTSAYWTINQLGAIFLSTNACTWNPYHIPASCCMLHGLTSLPPMTSAVETMTSLAAKLVQPHYSLHTHPIGVPGCLYWCRCTSSIWNMEGSKKNNSINIDTYI